MRKLSRDVSVIAGRDATVIEQTDPRGEHRTFMEFTAPSDVNGTLFLHLSPRGDAHYMGDSKPAETFGYVASELGKRGIHFGSIADVDLQEAITRGACDSLE